MGKNCVTHSSGTELHTRTHLRDKHGMISYPLLTKHRKKREKKKEERSM